MPKVNGTAKWAGGLMIAVMLGLSGWGLREVYAGLKERVSATEKVNNRQDSTDVRQDMEWALILQMLKTQNYNTLVIMDELEIAESRRRYVLPDSTRGN